jgi:Predicted transcriptional regulator, consists of a Zn-ribbon and ATP-cone domains
MRCPKCGSRDDKVIDSRQSRDGSSIRRRRQCLKCKYRYTTYEEIERSDLRVIKTNRTHEPFDRRKLAASIAKAFEKRSTSLAYVGGHGGRNRARTRDRRTRSSLFGDRRESA